ncbi:MAG: hypothetical protein KIT84_39255 [Labilithrix sp.]|nr:hypothetical protein [Labilithrix sp.]
MCTTASAVACVHDDKRPTGSNLTAESRAFVPPPAPIQYVVGDPGGARSSTIVIPLNGGAQGMVVDKRRVIVSRGEPRVAADAPTESISGAVKLPSRFGGGFLFWTENTIYRSDAFDSALVPVARTPDSIQSISFGPKAVMVRTNEGARWGIGLPKGERVPLLPLGVVDVVALDEGRALGFDDQGSVFTSIDGGEHWNDATAQVKATPTRVFIFEEELWLEDNNGNAMRLEPDGHLSWFDHVPEPPEAERPRDPRWHSAESPVRVAVRSGVAIDDSTALVLDSGDLFRVDVRTGDIVSVLGGKLPPDAMCQGMPVAGDVLFACIPRGGGSAFVVSHTLGGSDPIIEQTFASGSPFYGSDDGGLAYGSTCSSVSATPGSPPPNALPTACVRLPTGQWEERDVSNLSLDAGAGPGDVTVARWLPRADGRVVALISDPNPGLFDPVSGVLVALGDEIKSAARGSVGYSYPRYSYRGRSRYSGRYGPSGGMTGIIDGSWSYVGQNIRAAAAHGETYEISEDGKVKTSAYDLESVFYFAMGIGRSKDGRLYQTSDHGMTWTEVAAPPSGAESIDLLTCTTVGCDLGAFYRIGWSARPPRPVTPAVPAPPAPAVRRVRGLELSCRSSGAVVSKLSPRTEMSPEDLGLGAARVPAPDEKHDWMYVRMGLGRTIATPWSGPFGGDGDGGESIAGLRMMLTGFSAIKDDNDQVIASGPVRNINLLRRGAPYVAPFDPLGRVVRASIPMSEVIAAGRRAGVPLDELFMEDPTQSGNPIPLTPLDPNAVGDLALHDTSQGLLSIFRGERVRVAVRPSQGNNPVTFSGVVLPNDEAAFIEAEMGGPARVYKVGPGGVIDLFNVPQQEMLHGPNPDALAIDAKGNLSVIRTPSGSDPASALDSAYVVTPGSPFAPLAPWSTVKFADDPACKSEQGGYRTTLQVIGPWIRITTPDLKVEEAPMIARVRWTDKRVCLEGFEVKMPPADVRISAYGSPQTFSIGTWLVAKGSTFARVGVGEGVEWRQPMECTVVSTGP